MKYFSGQFIKNGFTLIELVVVIATMIILASIATAYFFSFRQQSDLTLNAEKIVSTLRLAQSKTLSSYGASQYGVYFQDGTNPNQYILFKGADYASRDILADEIFTLPKNIQINQINLAGTKELVFKRLNGQAQPAGSVELSLASELSKTKTIYIKSSGLISLKEVSALDDDRLKDSRHLHFLLGWSIKNATDLKFFFPSFAQTEIIPTQNFFNADKSEFYWEGSFLVGGKTQSFKIHTHNLDDFNTLLCFHRDRNQDKNDQEVLFYIIDAGQEKEIVHYLADLQDTSILGAFGGEMASQ